MLQIVLASSVLVCISGFPGFQQDNYTIIYERIEVVDYNREYYSDFKIINSKYNRTQAVSNVTYTLIRDVPSNIKMQVQANKFMSNEYRYFPILFSYSFCEGLLRDDYGMEIIFKCGNLTVTDMCPVYKKDTTNNLINISIYYEALCSDSARFITKQLYPAYKTIKGFSRIEFIPYGKATRKRILDTWLFKCQHGQLECWGNKAQACALAQNADQDIQLEFVNCFMAQYTYKRATYDCSNKTNMSYSNITKCLDGEMADELLVKYGDMTTAIDPPIKFIPAIVINGKHDNMIDNKAGKNFLKTITEVVDSIQKTGEKHNYGMQKVPPNYLYYDIFDKMKKIVYHSAEVKQINEIY